MATDFVLFLQPSFQALTNRSSAKGRGNDQVHLLLTSQGIPSPRGPSNTGAGSSIFPSLVWSSLTLVTRKPYQQETKTDGRTRNCCSSPKAIADMPSHSTPTIRLMLDPSPVNLPPPTHSPKPPRILSFFFLIRPPIRSSTELPPSDSVLGGIGTPLSGGGGGTSAGSVPVALAGRGSSITPVTTSSGSGEASWGGLPVTASSSEAGFDSGNTLLLDAR